MQQGEDIASWGLSPGRGFKGYKQHQSEVEGVGHHTGRLGEGRFIFRGLLVEKEEAFDLGHVGLGHAGKEKRVLGRKVQWGKSNVERLFRELSLVGEGRDHEG